MGDVFTPQKRSEIMSSIRSSETKPELLVRKALFALGYRYRKNYKQLPGRPDIVFPKYRTVVFVHGCFWHGHKNCRNARTPKTHAEYWVSKLAYNKRRDRSNKSKLERQAWQVVVVWECEVEQDLDSVIEKIIKALSQSSLD